MSSRKVRVKKLSVKTTLPVLREDQIDASEYESLITESQIATGVEQAEENTVEECISCQYDMTTEDNVFLKSHNAAPPAAGPLSHDDFERIMEVFEETAAEQTPFASVDNTVVSYDMMVPGLSHLCSPTILVHAKQIYEYWKSRRQDEGNKPLHPMLKFETHQETDDTDPYVCFRRREARQTRKTRARDNKIAETLKRLRRELEDGRQLIMMACERELMKREILTMDRALFEERARLKQIKVKLGIKGDNDDLINQKPQQKRKPAEPSGAPRPATQLRAPVRTDGRSHEQDLVLLNDQLAEKENELRHEIETKVQNHRRWNQNHIDLTRDPLSPAKELGRELKFRPAKTQYLMTPPASVSSDSMEGEDVPDAMQIDQPEPAVFRFRGVESEEPLQANPPAYRRRIGRLQRLWIDRRGVSTPSRTETSEYSDRWKYDSDDDDDDEPPVYEIDPFDTRALKFRATIPLNPYVYRGRPPVPPEAANAVQNGGGRVLPPPPPPPAAPQQAQAAS
ncbi:Enhancer of polycomb-like protein 1 [Escovopsis weberi]|uniref:Enhancer of polycomb-like protein n=1 Tax=Escovopsis weberi TaxID=150374 RepID=A0A0M8MXU4_ESCWE|nr:Enhancer of polycomb-like protein 1 [Escovopsis weberi]